MAADGSGQAALAETSVHEVKPAWSPDGNRLLFTEAAASGQAIHVLDLASGARTLVVENSRRDGAAAWSPDGERIAYLGEAEGQMGLYVIEADGTHPTRLLPSPTE
jgi:TolB protein